MQTATYTRCSGETLNVLQRYIFNLAYRGKRIVPHELDIAVQIIRPYVLRNTNRVQNNTRLYTNKI